MRESNPQAVHGYIYAQPLPQFSKYCYAYSLIVLSGKDESWHWGVKNNEDQWIDMQMYGLKRLLHALAEQDPDRRYRAHVYTPAAYLEQRLSMAAKTKRDMERGLPFKKLHNHEDWIETSTLWDLYRGAIREAISESEMQYVAAAEARILALQDRINSPLHTYKPFVESPGELILNL